MKLIFSKMGTKKHLIFIHILKLQLSRENKGTIIFGTYSKMVIKTPYVYSYSKH